MSKSGGVVKKVILVIDDASSDRHSLIDILTRRGYDVRAMLPAHVSARVVDELAPDLIVLDYESYAARAHLETVMLRGVPVIVSGALHTAEDRERVFAGGCVDYILKPYQAGEVLGRIETHLAVQALQQNVVSLNVEVQQQCEERQRAEAALGEINAALDHRITERTATLRASEAMFRYLLARANDGYVIVDSQEQVVYANAQAQMFLGIGHDSDQERVPNFRELAAKQYRCEPEAAWALWPKKMFINRAPVPLYLVRPETAISNTFWLQVEMLDISAGLDAEAGRIICLSDVTEKTALHDELNRFHAVISHKLRTPLVPLYTGLMFLVEQVATMPRDDIVMFVQNAFDGAEHLYSEIEEIVRYLGTSHAAPPGSGIWLHELEDMVIGISKDLSLPRVTVSLAESASDARLLPSQWSIELMLWELLENAKKFHPQHTPTVTIDVARVGVQQVRFRVSDDGLTLSPEQLARMWMPYYQADKYSTGQVSGMGLGLSMVATQVWSLGGTCRSYNRDDGPGIVVELVLPCSD